MLKKRAIITGFFVLSLMLFSVSCSDLYSTLNKLGAVLDNSGTNLLGFNGANKQVNQTMDALFNSEDSVFSKKDKNGDTKIDKISDKVNTLMDQYNDGKFNTSELINEKTNKISIDKVYGKYIEDFAMTNEEFASFASDIANLKTKEAKDKFALEMRSSAGLKLNGDLSPEIIKDRVTELKRAIQEESDMDESTVKIVNAVIDTLVTEDGEFTKGTAVILSSAATLVNKMLEASKTEETEPSLDNIKADEIIKEISQDFVNFASITLTVVGDNSKEGKVIYDTLNDLLKFN